MPSPNSEHEFLPTCSLENLKFRAAFLSKLRRFFDEREFIEVETPLLSSDIVVDHHIEPIEVTTLRFTEPRNPKRWLQTSPEFAMKRLLVAGADKIYQICKAFRNSERGPQHNPEFTMLEWYRADDDYLQGRELLVDFAQAVFNCPTVEQLSYSKAFQQVFNNCPLRSSTSTLLDLARRNTKVEFCGSESRDEILNALLSECIEPTLGNDTPVILYDFPASQAALARVREDSPPVAERFELYFHGIELANGYHELTDATVLMERSKKANQARKQDDKNELPTESRLLAAMRHGMPSCCGVAVGVDRLLMLLLDAQSIDEVIPFPIESA